MTEQEYKLQTAKVQAVQEEQRVTNPQWNLKPLTPSQLQAFIQAMEASREINWVTPEPLLGSRSLLD